MKSLTIRMKATEQYFPVVLFVMLYKVVLTFESVEEFLKVNMKMKALAEQYFPMLLLEFQHLKRRKSNEF